MNPIFVALDTTDFERAAELAKAVRGHAGGVKLGLEFFSAHGPQGIQKIKDLGLPLFLDLKLHDIPNTVGKAVQALAPLEPKILTVHAAGGRAMLEAARAAAPSKTLIVGVTVLTSLDKQDLEAASVEGSAPDVVKRRAALCRQAGIDGIVCSGAEVAGAHEEWPDGFFVVPGIRPQGSDVGDQKRVVTPEQALEGGASVLVIGRPITQAKDPCRAIMDIASSLEHRRAEARI